MNDSVNPPMHAAVNETVTGALTDSRASRAPADQGTREGNEGRDQGRTSNSPSTPTTSTSTREPSTDVDGPDDLSTVDGPPAPVEPTDPWLADEVIVVPPEIANAAIEALLRRQMGPLARQANNQAIVEAAGQATTVIGAVYGLIAADERAKVLAEAGADFAEISRMVTASYPVGMDPELVMRRRVDKVGNEYGEMKQALEGFTGENPRKGFYATCDDVIKELLDCASAALCAVEHLTDDEGRALALLVAQIAENRTRLVCSLAGDAP